MGVLLPVDRAGVLPVEFGGDGVLPVEFGPDGISGLSAKRTLLLLRAEFGGEASGEYSEEEETLIGFVGPPLGSESEEEEDDSSSNSSSDVSSSSELLSESSSPESSPLRGPSSR